MGMHENIFSLAGLKILITGATSGIGYETAMACARNGAEVIGIGRNPERLNALKSDLKEISGLNHEAVCFDVTDFDGIEGLIEEIVLKHGKLDGFVGAAGIPIIQSIMAFDSEDCRKLFDVNFIANMKFSSAFASKRASNDGASIVLISSVAGSKGYVGLTIYGATKSALDSACRCMAKELFPRKIRCNSLRPGLLKDTCMGDISAYLTEEAVKQRQAEYPLGFGEVKDVAAAAVFLLSPDSKWITGTNIPVDGGYTC